MHVVYRDCLFNESIDFEARKEFDFQRCSDQTIPEPTNSKLCLLPGKSEPYYDESEVMTVAYFALYVPNDRIGEVLTWTMLNKDAGALGYEVDTLVVTHQTYNATLVFFRFH